MKKIIISSLILCCCLLVKGSFCQDQQIRLWQDKAPGALGAAEGDIPVIDVFLPPANKKTGFGMIVFPGGSYGHISYGEEFITKDSLINRGITTFVCKYRTSPYKYPVPILDGKRAIRLVRARAAQWGIDPNHLGIMGFSAGGHLASTIGTRFDLGESKATDSIDRFSCRPDYMVLAYAVITMGPQTNTSTLNNLLGPTPSQVMIDSLSNEKHVSASVPPTFLNCGGADNILSNSRMFADSLKKYNVPCTLYVDPGMPHGYATGGTWLKVCFVWLKNKQLLTNSTGERIFASKNKESLQNSNSFLRMINQKAPNSATQIVIASPSTNSKFKVNCKGRYTNRK